ncbi:hypothetical protein Y032_0070g492 [Ancylostoma ceylanicum]|uniref:Uncharacterized protein n=1 Tax=Ancylostoma ceylanicum TaxID=53326 RepID=A0A016TZ03_9BILA|nr:hypothetical protein Y032_0070g492 [Ancylostoma ceylanicum]
MFETTRKRPASKLDDWLREGATGKKPTMDIDGMLASTTTRLLKEKLPFKKMQEAYDITQLYKDSGYFILEREKEQEAVRLIADLVASEQLPQYALSRVQEQQQKSPKKPLRKSWKKKGKLLKKKKNKQFKKT